VVFRVDLADDDDPAEVIAFCPTCAAKVFRRDDADERV